MVAPSWTSAKTIWAILAPRSKVKEWAPSFFIPRVRGEVSIPVLSHPTAAGRKRGPHNCGVCDGAVHRAILALSTTQREVERPSCRCEEAWRLQRKVEGFYQSPLGEWP